MTRTLDAWEIVILDGDYRISDLPDLIADARESIEKAVEAEGIAHEDELEKLEKELSDSQSKLSSAQEKLKARDTPVWGGCKRGCADAFLDVDGYCSPACRLGAPRGRYVTCWPDRSTTAAVA